MERYICFDMEEKAQQRAKELCEGVGVFPGVTKLIELETGKDPGECSRWEQMELKRLLR